MKQEEDSPFHFTKENEKVKWYGRTDGNTYYRYYHIYRKGQLAQEIKELEPRLKIEGIEYDKGNWFIILKK